MLLLFALLLSSVDAQVTTACDAVTDGRLCNSNGNCDWLQTGSTWFNGECRNAGSIACSEYINGKGCRKAGNCEWSQANTACTTKPTINSCSDAKSGKYCRKAGCKWTRVGKKPTEGFCAPKETFSACGDATSSKTCKKAKKQLGGCKWNRKMATKQIGTRVVDGESVPLWDRGLCYDENVVASCKSVNSVSGPSSGRLLPADAMRLCRSMSCVFNVATNTCYEASDGTGNTCSTMDKRLCRKHNTECEYWANLDACVDRTNPACSDADSNPAAQSLCNRMGCDWLPTKNQCVEKSS